jgi:hypothetical protein
VAILLVPVSELCNLLGPFNTLLDATAIDNARDLEQDSTANLPACSFPRRLPSD